MEKGHESRKGAGSSRGGRGPVEGAEIQERGSGSRRGSEDPGDRKIQERGFMTATISPAWAQSVFTSAKTTTVTNSEP